jgi:hypothetical protein
MKRESGENPEQTRCCKLRLRAEQTLGHWYTTLSSLPGKLPRKKRKSDIGKAFRHGSKSEDLPLISDMLNSFREIKLENDTHYYNFLRASFS